MNLRIDFKSLFFSFLFSFFFFGFLSITPAFAATHTLSGHVSDSLNNTIVGATVDVINANTNANAGSTTTNGSGDYNLVVVDGTYNVQVTPPSGSGFSPAIAVSQVIISDKVLNFILVPTGQAVLQGHVYDRDGTPVPNQTVALKNSNLSVVTQVTTNSSGSYTLQAVPPGNYYLAVAGGTTDSSIHVPQSYDMYVPYSLSQSTIMDITIPAYKVSLHVQDSSGQSVNNVGLSTTHLFGSGDFANGGGLSFNSTLGGGYGHASFGGTTDSSGNAIMWLFPNDGYGPHDYIINATPPSGSNSLNTSLTIRVSSDMNPTMVLNAQPAVLQGHVYDREGTAIPNQTVALKNSNLNVVTQTTTNSSGSYTLQAVPPGNYYLAVAGGTTDSSIHVPQSYDMYVPYSLSQSTSMDITVPAYKVNLHVQNSSGQSMNNVGLSTTHLFGSGDFANAGGLSYNSTLGGGYGHASFGGTTDSSGNAIMWLFPNDGYGPHDYIINATPPSGSGSLNTSLTIRVSNDMNPTMVLNAQPAVLQGYVYDRDGTPVPNQTVALKNSNLSVVTQTTTNSSGNYTLQAVPPGNYYLAVAGGTSDPSIHIPQSYDIYLAYTLAQSTSIDITVPADKVNLHVQDALGQAVGNVGLSTTHLFGSGDFANAGGLSYNSTLGGGYGHASFGGTTDSSGNATMWLFPNDGYGPHDYIINATPPSGSPYSPFALNGIRVTGDRTDIISLQYNHALPVTTIDLATQHSDQTYSNPTTVTLSATADTGYTIANTYYKVDGGAQQTYTAPFTVTGSGDHSIEYWSVDNSGVQESHKTKDFTIYINQSPYVDPLPDVEINQGQTYTATGSFTDGDSTSWTATVDYEDGAGPQNLPLNPDKTFNLSHQYPTAGTYTVTIVVTDDGGATGTTSATVTVNAPPVIAPLPDETIFEAGLYQHDGSFIDDDSTSWTGTVDYGDGDGDGEEPLTLNPDKTFTLHHVYKDNKQNNDPYTITVKITDNQGAVGTQTAMVTVKNAKPVVGVITASVNPIQVNNSTSVSTTFTDAGVLDTHTAIIDWGDGMTSFGNVTGTNDSGNVSGDHVYLAAGVYTITLTVTDKDNESGQATPYQYLSVYNPTPQGLFSGARIFSSPAGAYTDNPNLTGQVQFGVTAKYQNGIPTGNVSMKFNAANLQFDATGITALVTASGKATLRGEGTITGRSGTFDFLVTGIDGVSDTIRFQITDPSNNDAVVYDSQLGAEDTADPTASVTGQVIVH